MPPPPLVGRDSELARLMEAAEALSSGGGGRVVSLVGEAGIGKTRLLDELRASPGEGSLRWLEGRARPDRVNVPYGPLAGLLRDAWGIDAADSQAAIRAKIERNTARLLPDQPDAFAYLGRLFALESDELEDVDPEAWRKRVHEIARDLLRSLAETRPTIVVLEDFHWADPSTIALVRELAERPDLPVLIICAYRPPFELIEAGTVADGAPTKDALVDGAAPHEVIALSELSPDDAAHMVAGLLETDALPFELVSLIERRTEGNPFHLEELTRALTESGTIEREGKGWRVAGELAPSKVPLGLEDVLASRVDNLSEGAREVLREAAVIGQVFPYEILREITADQGALDECLASLERLDLVRPGSDATTDAAPAAQYSFKHDLTRDAAYDDLSDDARPALHERLAEVLETTYRERLAEASDSLAFHYARGLSLDKAVRYLMMSGAKSVQQYALDEAHRYFEQAFELVSGIPEAERTAETDGLLVDILGTWGLVFPYDGEFEALRETLAPHRAVVERRGDPASSAAFYVALSAGEWGSDHPVASDELARRTCELAKVAGNRPLEGIGLNSRAWALVEMGELDDAVRIGWRAHELAKDLPGHPIAQWASLHAVGIAHWYQGEIEAGERAGVHLTGYSKQRGNPRGLFAAAFCRSHARHSAGDFDGAVDYLAEACELPSDPVHMWGARGWIGAAHEEAGRYEDAEQVLEALRVETEGRCGFMTRLAQLYLAPCLAARGLFGEAEGSLRDAMAFFEATGNVCRSRLAEYLLGKVLLGLVERAAAGEPNAVRKAAIPGIADLDAADRAAAGYLALAIEGAEAIGAHGIACPAHLALARLHAAMGRAGEARASGTIALEDARRRGAAAYAGTAQELLEGLGG